MRERWEGISDSVEEEKDMQYELGKLESMT